MWVCFGSFFILLKFWQIYAAYFLGEGEPFLAPGGLLKILFLAGGRGYHRSPLHWEPVAWGEYDFVYSIFSLYRRWERWWPWIGEPSVKLSVGILNWCDLSKFLWFVKFSVSWLRKSLFQFNFCVGLEAWIYLNCFSGFCVRLIDPVNSLFSVSFRWLYILTLRVLQLFLLL